MLMSKMPALFVGHGSPMNAIEDNQYTGNWRSIAERIPKPEVILSVSAHWFTKGTKIMNEENPKTIYDMYGFPKKLYEVTYNTAGSPGFAKVSKDLISRETKYDNSWGIDHGTWSVLVHMYPDREIPVYQISIDADAPPEAHYKIGKDLRALREQGVLIFGTGNIVHNLRMVDWNKTNEGFDWAYEFDEYIYENILNKNHDNILKFNETNLFKVVNVPMMDDIKEYCKLAFYGALAVAYDRIGTDATWEQIELCASEECSKMEAALREIAVENEANPAQIDWKC